MEIDFPLVLSFFLIVLLQFGIALGVIWLMFREPKPKEKNPKDAKGAFTVNSRREKFEPG